MLAGDEVLGDSDSAVGTFPYGAGDLRERMCEVASRPDAGHLGLSDGVGGDVSGVGCFQAKSAKERRMPHPVGRGHE